MYTPEQISIAKKYETLIFANMHNEEEYDRLMAEFEEIKVGWDKEE